LKGKGPHQRVSVRLRGVELIRVRVRVRVRVRARVRIRERVRVRVRVRVILSAAPYSLSRSGNAGENTYRYVWGERM